MQGRGTRRQLRIQNLWRLIDRWDALQGKRLKAAKYIFDNWDDRANLPGSAYEVLDTLELLGYLVKTKTLSLDDVWINVIGGRSSGGTFVSLESSQTRQPTVLYEYSLSTSSGSRS